MTYKRNQSIIKTLLNSKIFFVAMLILVFLFSRATYGAFRTMQESESRLGFLEKTHNDLQATVFATESDLEYLRSETGLESEIRAKFDYAKEGERAIMIMDPEIEEEVIVEEKSFWKKVKGLFER